VGAESQQHEQRERADERDPRGQDQEQDHEYGSDQQVAPELPSPHSGSLR
jgi:hypothetical protein